MIPIDLFLLSKTKSLSLDEFINYYLCISCSKRNIKARPYERSCLYQLTDYLINSGCNLVNLQGFYYSFSIEQIGKEFDLLKIYDNRIVNIELKSELTTSEDILTQLKSNDYYLSCLGKTIYSYTYIASTNTLFKFENNNIVKVEIQDILNALNINNNYITLDIDQLFNPSLFLVSPFNNGDKFIQGNYFLTNHQSSIKKEILKLLETNSCKYFKIAGDAGTGKTLLVYDIAKELSKDSKVCIIHSGKTNKGHEFLNRHLNNVTIISAKAFKRFDINNFKLVIVDESQRLRESEFERLLSIASNNTNINVIFSIGPDQIMQYREARADINSKIDILSSIKKYNLTNKIRTNKNISSFIKNIVNLKDVNCSANYSCIDIHYAETESEAKQLLKYLSSLNFVYISFTPSYFNSHNIDKFISAFNTHDVIGQEYDNVVMLLGDEFGYVNERLGAKVHPNPDFRFSKMFYQGITRARLKLAIIVLNNNELYKKILNIKLHCYSQ